MTRRILVAAAVGALCLAAGSTSRADEIPQKYRGMVRKGLEYLAKQMKPVGQKQGYWASNGTAYPVSMTALAGMAFLMEGSTPRAGKYKEQINRATEWLLARSNKGNNRDGLIGDTTNSNEAARYMYGHGFATLFLASVYGDAVNVQQQERIKDVLTRAVKYTINAQVSKGGFYYTAKNDPPGMDREEGSVTITQVQALRACRNAGIPVPKAVIKKVYNYLKEATSPNGAVYYSLQSRMERPPITAAAVACLFSAGEYKDELGKKWLKYCRKTIPVQLGAPAGGGIRIGHDEYTHYYYAQCIYMLGDKGWEKLFGPTAEEDRLTWTKYRDKLFDQLLTIQNADGSFPTKGGFGVGPVYSTAMWLTVLQLDSGLLPIYQR
jgi:hypothetical protein